MKNSRRDTIALILAVAAIAVAAVFDAFPLSITENATANFLLSQFIPRLLSGLILVAVVILLGYKNVLLPDFKTLPKDLLWCIPCFLVAIVNFPFSALIKGTAEILETDLIWLFAFDCFAVGLFEELLFRALLIRILEDMIKDTKWRMVYTTVISSSVFALIHLLNLFSGAAVGDTFMQVGYCFLIGAMLSAVLYKTNNLWLCVIIHAVFDFGGNIVTYLGAGHFQDLIFWILTAVAGVICLIHVLRYFIIATKDGNKK